MFEWLKRKSNGSAEGMTLNVQPDFNTCLILAIEMLKRGVVTVDMHPWGLRLRAPAASGGVWSVGMIPQAAQDEYAESLFGTPAPVAVPPEPEPESPIVGEEDPNEQAPEVGPTP